MNGITQLPEGSATQGQGQGRENDQCDRDLGSNGDVSKANEPVANNSSPLYADLWAPKSRTQTWTPPATLFEAVTSKPSKATTAVGTDGTDEREREPQGPETQRTRGRAPAPGPAPRETGRDTRAVSIPIVHAFPRAKISLHGTVEAEIGPFSISDKNRINSDTPAQTAQKRHVGVRKKTKRKGRSITGQVSSILFWDVVKERLPRVNEEAGFGELLAYLVYSVPSYQREKKVLLPHAMLARMAGESEKHFSSGAFLDRFKDAVLPDFVWSPYSVREKTREVIDLGMPDWLDEGLSKELRQSIPWRQPQVWFGSGCKVSKNDAKELRSRELEKVDAAMQQIPVTEDAEYIQRYLHDLGPRTLTTLIDAHADEADAFVDAIEEDHIRDAQKVILRNIVQQPLPFYAPVNNSYRLFSTQAGLQQVMGDVRRIILQGCFDMDADALHLTIMAVTWDVPELRAMLDRVGAKGMWRAITEHMAGGELSPSDHAAWKGAVKHGIYALGYGGGASTIAQQIRDHDDTGLIDNYDWAVYHLKTMPEMAALFDAKDRMLKSIIERAGMQGAFGWIPLKKGRNPLSVLAMASSSFELALMRTLFEVANEHPKECKIVLYQFDGVSVKFMTHGRQAAFIRQKMIERFAERATALGLSSTLKAELIERP